MAADDIVAPAGSEHPSFISTADIVAGQETRSLEPGTGICEPIAIVIAPCSFGRSNLTTSMLKCSLEDWVRWNAEGSPLQSLHVQDNISEWEHSSGNRILPRQPHRQSDGKIDPNSLPLQRSNSTARSRTRIGSISGHSEVSAPAAGKPSPATPRWDQICRKQYQQQCASAWENNNVGARFHHFGNMSMYMESYRKQNTVGNAGNSCKTFAEVEEEDDPYIRKFKSMGDFGERMRWMSLMEKNTAAMSNQTESYTVKHPVASADEPHQREPPASDVVKLMPKTPTLLLASNDRLVIQTSSPVERSMRYRPISATICGSSITTESQLEYLIRTCANTVKRGDERIRRPTGSAPPPPTARLDLEESQEPLVVDHVEPEVANKVTRVPTVLVSSAGTEKDETEKNKNQKSNDPVQLGLVKTADPNSKHETNVTKSWQARLQATSNETVTSGGAGRTWSSNSQSPRCRSSSSGRLCLEVPISIVVSVGNVDPVIGGINLRSAGVSATPTGVSTRCHSAFRSLGALKCGYRLSLPDFTRNQGKVKLVGTSPGTNERQRSASLAKYRSGNYPAPVRPVRDYNYARPSVCVEDLQRDTGLHGGRMLQTTDRSSLIKLNVQ